MTYLNAVHFK